MPDYAVSMGFGARDLGIMEQYDKMSRGAEDYGDRASRAFKKINDHSSQAFRNATKHGYKFGAIVKGILAADLIRGGVNKVTEAMTSPFEEFINFDHEMTQAMVRFEDVGPRAANFKQIVKDTGKEIRQLALTSKFSFTDLAKAYSQVGRSKMFDHKEGVQALVPLMNLNIDAQGDFEESSKNVMEVMGAWAMNTLPVEERLKALYNMTDLFAQAQNEAQVSVTNIADTMKTVGPIMRGMGYEIKDATAMMLLLGKAGIKGDEAATALKNISSHLVNTVTQGKFANMQVPIVDKLTGAPRKLEHIFKDLNTQLKKYTLNQRMGILFEGFGLRAIAGSLDITRQLGDYEEIGKRLKNITGVGAENAARINADMKVMMERLKNSFIEKGMQILDKYGDRFLAWLERTSAVIQKFNVEPVVNGLDSLGNVLGIVYSIVSPFLSTLPYLILGFYGWKAALFGLDLLRFAAAIGVVAQDAIGLLGIVGALKLAWMQFTAAVAANPIGMIALGLAGIYASGESLRTGKDNFISQAAQSLGIVPKLAYGPDGRVIGRASDFQAPNQKYPAPNAKTAGGIAGRYELAISGAPTGTTFSGSSYGGAPALDANMMGKN